MANLEIALQVAKLQSRPKNKVGKLIAKPEDVLIASLRLPLLSPYKHTHTHTHIHAHTHAYTHTHTHTQVLFAFWGAEELGLLGSYHYVGSLGDEERNAIALNLNFDMLVRSCNMF